MRIMPFEASYNTKLFSTLQKISSGMSHEYDDDENTNCFYEVFGVLSDKNRFLMGTPRNSLQRSQSKSKSLGQISTPQYVDVNRIYPLPKELVVKNEDVDSPLWEQRFRLTQVAAKAFWNNVFKKLLGDNSGREDTSLSKKTTRCKDTKAEIHVRSMLFNIQIKCVN